MALGAFFAGLLLAESEFRHQVEADIQPFKGILLGLFFMTVGMQIDLPTIVSDLGLLLAIVFGIVAIQLVVIVVLARAFGLGVAESLRVGLLLAHAGEFAFVILQTALVFDVIRYDTARILTVAAALSMFLPPLFDALGARLAARMARENEMETDLDALVAETGELRDFVIIAGFGRVGQAIAKLLNVQGIKWVAIDRDAKRVTEARKRDLPVYYGDTTRPEVLEAAGIANAVAAACAIDARNGAVKTVRAMHHAAPTLMIFSRARDHEHSVALNEAGAGFVFPETMEAAMLLGTRILDQAGKRPENLDEMLLQLRREGPFMLEPPEQEEVA
jgi:CPA2 family monovalent cation:H+ antiporter-2